MTPQERTAKKKGQRRRQLQRNRRMRAAVDRIFAAADKRPELLECVVREERERLGAQK
jgi:hypothetical protein